MFSQLMRYSPIQKFVARKARKFEEQGNRLCLPTLEFAWNFLGIAHAPGTVVETKMLPEVEKSLAKLNEHASDPSKYYNGKGYWDDLCLTRFLEGVCLRYLAYPVRRYTRVS